MTNNILDALAATIAEKSEEANAIVERNATVSVKAKDRKAWREDENNDNESVQKYQAYVNDLNAKIMAAEDQINALYDSLHNVTTVSDEDRAADKETHKSLRDEVTLATKLFTAMGGDTSTLPTFRNFSGGAGKSGGTGTKRPRIAAATVNGEDVTATRTTKDGEEETFVTFSVLAQTIGKDAGTKVTPKMLHEAAFDAAGTDDLSTVAEVAFNFSAEGKSYDVVIFPSQSEEDEG